MRFVCTLAIAALFAIAGLSGHAVGQEAPAILLWPAGAPNARSDAGPETVRLVGGERVVANVHAPSLTPYLPTAATATGAAVIVMPGGGHRELWTDHEGHAVARWLSEHGVAAFVLKYRLARADGSTYTIEGDEMADARRAIRLVRSRATEWGLNPGAIGAVGFSAGSQLASRAGALHDAGQPNAADPIERQSSQPDFMGLIYGNFPDSMNPSPQSPPAFLLVGAKDQPFLIDAYLKNYAAMRAADAPVELHILAGAEHGFGIRRANAANVAAWPSMFLGWLQAGGFAGKPKAAF